MNRDRLTFAFRPTMVTELREEVDRLVLDALQVDPSQAAMLVDFERKVVSIDGSVRLTKPRQKMGRPK